MLYFKFNYSFLCSQSFSSWGWVLEMMRRNSMIREKLLGCLYPGHRTLFQNSNHYSPPSDPQSLTQYSASNKNQALKYRFLISWRGIRDKICCNMTMGMNILDHPRTKCIWGDWTIVSKHPLICRLKATCRCVHCLLVLFELWSSA